MFFVACFEHLPTKEKDYDIGDCHTFGYFDNYDDCRKALNCNEKDIHECCYDYGVIEEVESGIHAFAKGRQFFKYNKEKDGFFEIEEPVQLKKFYNFTIG